MQCARLRACQRLARRRAQLRCHTQLAPASRPVVADDTEYTDVPQYPPILDLSPEARVKRKRDKVHEKIRIINTVEEKAIALNMPRMYGFRCTMFNEDLVPFNAMPLVQCYTRTHFRPVKELPDIYLETEPAAELVAKETKSQIEDTIAAEFDGIKREFNYNKDKFPVQEEEDAVTRCVVQQINRIITNNLADRLPHILSAQVDVAPRHEAFWFVGGVDVPPNVVKWRKEEKKYSLPLDIPVDRAVQYLGTPMLAMRSNLPLRPLIPYSEATNPDFTVPKYTYFPETTGYIVKHRHGTNIPGFWPGDEDEFGLLSIHGRGHILARKPSFGAEDNLEALHCQAMKSSFGWLLAQASYQGFNTYNDLKYPLVTQTLITNGQLWSLYAYQLNTVTMFGEHMDENPKRNILFGTEPLKLFESVENGKVVGFNEDVLKKIVQLYMNAPEARDYDMKPYLGEEEQVIADIEDDSKRNWLEKVYKHLVSNRPRHRLIPEIYQWEQIYKIQFNTRFHEARRRPFELGKNPFKKRLNQHHREYIPKVLRPYPKSKKKWVQTYYPKV